MKEFDPSKAIGQQLEYAGSKRYMKFSVSGQESVRGGIGLERFIEVANCKLCTILASLRTYPQSNIWFLVGVLFEQRMQYIPTNLLTGLEVVSRERVERLSTLIHSYAQ